MLSLNTERDLLRALAAATRVRRQAAGLRQADLAQRSGVSLPTVRKLEQSGRVGVFPLAKILTTLGMTDDLITALKRSVAPQQASSVEEFLGPEKKRTRIRVRRP